MDISKRAPQQLSYLLLPVVLAKKLLKNMLKYDSPESVGLLSEAFEDLRKNVTEYTTPANYGLASNNEAHSLYPGATVV